MKTKYSSFMLIYIKFNQITAFTALLVFSPKGINFQLISNGVFNFRGTCENLNKLTVFYSKSHQFFTSCFLNTLRFAFSFTP